MKKKSTLFIIIRINANLKFENVLCALFYERLLILDLAFFFCLYFFRSSARCAPRLSSVVCVRVCVCPFKMRQNVTNSFD